ncbi:unnamed protein product [Diabrotica balteata]|uniref:Uncharacterized protein n=1 Tax=Diabrotica balteata TaxID=107213 RepID=A0A9N9SPK7_DIABA|nr:unnamed protein product [Diabrotica balteata]
MRAALWILVGIYLCNAASGQGDSLRSALNAINRREKDLDRDYDEGEFGYPIEHPEDVVFLNPDGFVREEDYEKPLSSSLDNRYDGGLNKRISSAFRERLEEDNQKQQLEEMARSILSQLENTGRYNVENEDYEELLREYFDKYRRPYEINKINSNQIDKRFMYPKFGLDSVGLKKRTNELYEDGYPQKDDFYDGQDLGDYGFFNKKRFYQSNKLKRIRQMYSNPYSPAKRFPVTKRSSDYKDFDYKPSIPKKQTDPKVEKELSHIFGTPKVEEKPATTKKPVSTKPTTPKKESAVTKPPKEEKPNKKVALVNKEEFTPVSLPTEKPLQIKKKSVDWSEYFGLDRRKKSSEPDDLDKEWLIERYHKSIKMSNKKRNAELPLSSFRNHDEHRKKATSTDEKSLSEEQKINDMDSKLQVMEDKIVDDALKYTGSREGESDPKEVQEIKDKVISKLAAAYSLEKMRTALGEYRVAVAKERERLRNRRPTTEDDDMFLEEKRSVPRKQVSDKEIEKMTKGDNDIKCAEGDDDCHEQNYKTPVDIIESHYGTELCPAIVRSCNDYAVGMYGELFKPACHLYQMCLLCSNYNRSPPIRTCQALFVAKAFELCKGIGDYQCQNATQYSLRYLNDLTYTFHEEDPVLIAECERSCPETGALLG